MIKGFKDLSINHGLEEKVHFDYIFDNRRDERVIYSRNERIRMIWGKVLSSK